MSETDKKPTGPAAAAKELWEPLRKVFVAAKCEIPENMEENIEAIILKHCPQDKAEKLMEVARNVVDIFHTEAKTYEAMAMVMKLKAALAEYEKVNE